MFTEGALSELFIDAVVSSVQADTGAQAVFIGRVRPDKKDNVTVSYIEFTAQKEIAIATATDIILESREKFGIHHAEVWHSIGKINAGEACFLVAVNGIHRKECFKALEYIVDQFKERCPVFGKEIMSDRSALWKENRT